jgi:hypothetical protein
MPVDGPPAYAWDWLARQRVAWHEARRRLVAHGRGPGASGDVARRSPRGPDSTGPAGVRSAGGAFGPIPDWAADHPDLVAGATTRASAADAGPAGRDYRGLDTRAEVIAALRADYPQDAAVRAVVDRVIAEVAFLDRLDVPLHALGVRSAPRGMRWWWCHLGGAGVDGDERSVAASGTEPPPTVPTQLRLVDVHAGYGDGWDA